VKAVHIHRVVIVKPAPTAHGVHAETEDGDLVADMECDHQSDEAGRGVPAAAPRPVLVEILDELRMEEPDSFPIPSETAHEADNTVKHVADVRRRRVHQENRSPVVLSLLELARPRDVVGRPVPDIGLEFAGWRAIHPKNEIVIGDRSHDCIDLGDDPVRREEELDRECKPNRRSHHESRDLRL
jgi:hypothetical protein